MAAKKANQAADSGNIRIPNRSAKKIEEAKEEQQREFRNERAELEAAYQAELQAKTAQISQLKAPEEQKTQAPKQSFNYFD